MKTHDLSPKHNYIILSHPHGILSYGAFINFATESTGFSRVFPSITPFLATLEGIFWIPFVRDYLMSLGKYNKSSCSEFELKMHTPIIPDSHSVIEGLTYFFLKSSFSIRSMCPSIKFCATYEKQLVGQQGTSQAFMSFQDPLKRVIRRLSVEMESRY